MTDEGADVTGTELSETCEQSSGIKLVGKSLQTLDQQTQQNAALVEATVAPAASQRQWASQSHRFDTGRTRE
jgi:methyl-accepting chemotaxis protein